MTIWGCIWSENLIHKVKKWLKQSGESSIILNNVLSVKAFFFCFSPRKSNLNLQKQRGFFFVVSSLPPFSQKLLKNLVILYTDCEFVFFFLQLLRLMTRVNGCPTPKIIFNFWLHLRSQKIMNQIVNHRESTSSVHPSFILARLFR